MKLINMQIISCSNQLSRHLQMSKKSLCSVINNVFKKRFFVLFHRTGNYLTPIVYCSQQHLRKGCFHKRLSICPPGGMYGMGDMHGQEVCGRGCAWLRGMHGQGACIVGECTWQGACITGYLCGWGMHG